MPLGFLLYVQGKVDYIRSFFIWYNVSLSEKYSSVISEEADSVSARNCHEGVLLSAFQIQIESFWIRTHSRSVATPSTPIYLVNA